ncbi:MAG: hypothetical protein WCL18_03905 [bacterium]
MNITLLMAIFLELISSIGVVLDIIYSEQPDHAPGRTYSRAGSTQIPLAKKLMLPSCPLKYKTSVIHCVSTNQPLDSA